MSSRPVEFSVAPSNATVQEMSPALKARIAGAAYLAIIVSAAFAFLVVRDRLLVPGNGAATAANILAHEALYRWGGAISILTLVCDAIVAVIFYDLFKPVSRSLSLFAAVLRLIFVAIMGFNTVNYFAPLVLLHGNRFSTTDSQAFTLVSQTFFSLGYNIAIIFFGLQFIVIGYLILRSGFLPRLLGSVMITGLFYFANSFVHFVAPAAARGFAPYLVWPAALLEWSLALWLLIAGVDNERWRLRAERRLDLVHDH